MSDQEQPDVPGIIWKEVPAKEFTDRVRIAATVVAPLARLKNKERKIFIESKNGTTREGVLGEVQKALWVEHGIAHEISERAPGTTVACRGCATAVPVPQTGAVPVWCDQCRNPTCECGAKLSRGTLNPVHVARRNGEAPRCQACVHARPEIRCVCGAVLRRDGHTLRRLRKLGVIPDCRSCRVKKHSPECQACGCPITSGSKCRGCMKLSTHQINVDAERVAELIRAGHSLSSAAGELGVSRATAIRRLKKSGSHAEIVAFIREQQGGHRRQVLKACVCGNALSKSASRPGYQSKHGPPLCKSCSSKRQWENRRILTSDVLCFCGAKLGNDAMCPSRIAKRNGAPPRCQACYLASPRRKQATQ